MYVSLSYRTHLTVCVAHQLKLLDHGGQQTGHIKSPHQHNEHGICECAKPVCMCAPPPLHVFLGGKDTGQNVAPEVLQGG